MSIRQHGEDHDELYVRYPPWWMACFVLRPTIDRLVFCDTLSVVIILIVGHVRSLRLLIVYRVLRNLRAHLHTPVMRNPYSHVIIVHFPSSHFCYLHIPWYFSFTLFKMFFRFLIYPEIVGVRNARILCSQCTAEDSFLHAITQSSPPRVCGTIMIQGCTRGNIE